jgi:phosphoglycerate dehydrogenase-like enzyme
MLVLIDTRLSPQQENRIRGLSPLIRLMRLDPTATNSYKAELAKAEVLYTTQADLQPDDVPNLRWIQLDTAAVDEFLTKPLAKSGARIANVSGAYSVAVAECAIGMLLALTRRIALASQFQAKQHWPTNITQLLGNDLFGLTLGIVGYGSIGRQIAKIANCFGMKVLACKREPNKRHEGSTYRMPNTGDPEGTIPEAWFGTEQIAAMWSQCDIVVVTLPLTPHTRGLIGEPELEALPDQAYLINVGRGPVVSESALVHFLKEGRLAGVALDVFDQEPLPPESPLWKLPNVLVLPHIASWTKSQSDSAADVLIENLSRDLKGEPLLNVIDKRSMY